MGTLHIRAHMWSHEVSDTESTTTLLSTKDIFFVIDKKYCKNWGAVQYRSLSVKILLLLSWFEFLYFLMNFQHKIAK